MEIPGARPLRPPVAQGKALNLPILSFSDSQGTLPDIPLALDCPYPFPVKVV